MLAMADTPAGHGKLNPETLLLNSVYKKRWDHRTSGRNRVGSKGKVMALWRSVNGKDESVSRLLWSPFLYLRIMQYASKIDQQWLMMETSWKVHRPPRTLAFSLIHCIGTTELMIWCDRSVLGIWLLYDMYRHLSLNNFTNVGWIKENKNKKYIAQIFTFNFQHCFILMCIHQSSSTSPS